MESQQFSVVQDFRGLDDDGDNAFHIAAETAKMICENLDWLIVMLRNSDADIEVRKHRLMMLRTKLLHRQQEEHHQTEALKIVKTLFIV
ncbi:hypothetical protein Ahy_A02g009565 isoform E [Arachis hypogaea]|uniref:Uncharacterized protein n=1 Tax=Arachis hypogaea TaxID=3818 RepID=A0A445EHF1_ARAHY|nr:hypothetical protein Ahy_A02g009565 isoform E [Arachis hypogaea]